MRQRIRLTESQLHRMIKESVKEILCEGTSSDNSVLKQWEFVKEKIGAEDMLDCIWGYLNDTQLEDIIECFRQDDILPSEDEEYEYEDYEY